MRTPEGAVHWNDQWHFALARIANACRAYGLRPIDGPYANYADVDGYRASCRRASTYRCTPDMPVLSSQ